MLALEESDPPLDLACLRTLPGFDLRDPQALTRLRINEIENILELLAGGLSWVSDETAIADAHETYAYHSRPTTSSDCSTASTGELREPAAALHCPRSVTQRDNFAPPSLRPSNSSRWRPGLQHGGPTCVVPRR